MVVKYAIHVPCEELSEAVQKRLFKMGYSWWINGESSLGIANIDAEHFENPCIDFDLEDKRMCFTNESFYVARNYTILTVDEFFKREEEKEEWPKALNLGSLEVTATKTRVVLTNGDDDESVTVYWDELEQIRKLRPREG